MICNKDVVNWFRNLKSYSRIDTMCIMLNMCLPFELRFLGTYLEDLGRRDAPELRGAELKVNNPQEFIADIASGEPTDQRIRRKMALFLALYRACNHAYANELFKTLEGWGARSDLQRLFEEDDQQELLLVYTMATNHPVFSFEQRLHCGEIFTKLKSWEPKANHRGSGDRDDAALEQQQQPQQHHSQHHHQQPPSQHHSMDSLHSNSPQQSPIQQQQQHHQQHQPQHLQNSTPPPAVPPPGTATLHALPPNAALSMQNLPQGPASLGQPVTLSYTGLPGLTQTLPNDATLTPTHYLDTLHALPVQTDFTIPPPVSSRWVQSVYQQLSYPPPSSSPHMSNPSSPIQSRTTSPTRIHPSSVQHRISRNQQNDQQQQQQNQSQMQSLKPVDEDQTMVMLSQMQLRNGMRQTHNTLPRQSKQNYVTQLPPYHHQQQQQQQHHSQRDSGIYHTANYNMKGVGGVMMDIMNHQPNSTGSDSGSSIGSTGEVSPPETPGVAPASIPTIPHARSNRSNNMRNINGRPEKQYPSMTYSQLHQQHQQNVAHQQQQQQFAGTDLMVPGTGQTFIATGTTNGATMSGTGNNGATGAGVVSAGQVLINQPGGQFVYAGTPASFPQVSVSHRSVANAALSHGTAFRTAPAYAQTIQPQAPQSQTAEPILYQYHPTAVVATGVPGPTVVANSAIPYLPPQPPSSTVASTQTNLPGAVRSSPSPQIGLLQQTKVAAGGSSSYGATTSLPYTSSAPSCYNCGSLKHTGLDCPEASMEDMTRTSNFTLDYNTISNSATSPGTVTTPTTTTIPSLGVGTGNSNNNTTQGTASVVLSTNVASGEGSSSTNSSSSSSNSSNTNSGNGNKSNNTTSLSSSNTISASSNSNNNNNNNNLHHHHHHHHHHGTSGSVSSSSSNSNNSSVDVPLTGNLLPVDAVSGSSNSISTSSNSSGNSGAAGSTGSGNSSNAGSGGGSNNSSNLVSASDRFNDRRLSAIYW
ncbi:transcription factor mef2A isoform X2 [Anopheles moucheti]|uniref:transcription factor mef2A isoform X2 n=1 Tax=Anopheles moucheti TaxID=186751 RepID=UPI0022F0763D|nr:transcription factor mef2A isoform X2 [Anopheles moucheti]